MSRTLTYGNGDASDQSGQESSLSTRLVAYYRNVAGHEAGPPRPHQAREDAMRLWPFGRRRQREQLDQTGPATGYGHCGGATTGRPIRDQPTTIDGWPLVTYGQQQGYRRIGGRP